MVTDTELSEVSEEYLRLLGIYENERKVMYCFYCGKWGTYLDYSGVDYCSEDSQPILRSIEDNEPHCCMNMMAAKGSRTFATV